MMKFKFKFIGCGALLALSFFGWMNNRIQINDLATHAFKTASQPGGNIKHSHWFIIHMPPSKDISHLCSSPVKSIASSIALTYDDENVYKILYPSLTRKCVIIEVNVKTPKHYNLNGGKQKALIFAVMNGAKKIWTVSNWRNFQNLMWNDFSKRKVNLTSPVIGKVKINSKQTNIIGKPELIVQSSNETLNNLIQMDFENGEFIQSVFWLLPIVSLNSCENWIWSQIMSSIFTMNDWPIGFSKNINSNMSGIINNCPKMDMKVNISSTKIWKTMSTKAPFSHNVISVYITMLNKLFPPNAIQRKKVNAISDWVRLVDELLNPMSKPKITHKIKNKGKLLHLYRKTCSSSPIKVDITHPWLQFSKIVLVTIFNRPNITWLPYFELFYRPFFPTIIHCIPSYAKETFKDWNLTFVKFERSKTETDTRTFYLCVPAVWKLNLTADGYLFIQDDLLYSMHAFLQLPKDVPAISHDLPSSCSMEHPSAKCKTWYHLRHVIKEMKELKRIKPLSDLSIQCFKRMKAITNRDDAAPIGNADIFYIPTTIMAKASELYKFISRKKVFVEVGTLYVLACITDTLPTNISGLLNWTKERNQFYEYGLQFKKGDIDYYHPAKFSYILKGGKKYANGYCNDYLPFNHMLY